MLSNIHQLRSNAIMLAQQFIGTKDSLTVLGWGISGFVFMSPDLRTAIKVHHNSEAHETEVKAYTILKQHRITSLCGLTVPRMHKSDRVRHLIQMDCVSPPFLLDFAGVKFTRPDFPPDTMADIYATIEERFGKNAHIAYDVYHMLSKIGMYYLDLRPSNLNIRGLPGIIQDEENSD